ncbi:acetamidase [Xylariales sp. PMI_506]|nr:acetamidase [Xylariales sp. PMI_506]
MASNWEAIAADKRTRLEKTIPPEWKIEPTLVEKSRSSSPLEVIDKSKVLSEAELQIVRSTATDLVAKLANGELTAVEVTLAFCKRAALAHQLVNCALEFFPEIALARARDLDLAFKQTGKPVGPLHGLPISLKDQMRVKGVETSMGYVSWLGTPATEDSVIVTLLLEAGAVFFVKTSVPQSLMCCETFNNVSGLTVNPRSYDWSCGGSSGGEGANVALRGGLIGIGTDIGGSIRVPAAFNFLYGLRPSHGRFPYAGMVNSMDGQETIHSVCGPIAHSVADLRLFSKSLLLKSPWRWDAKVIPKPWSVSEEESIKAKLGKNGLAFGFFNDDGNVLPHPPVLRAMDTVLDAVKKAGHKVVPWDTRLHPEAVRLVHQIYQSDGNRDIADTLAASGEPVIPHIGELGTPKDPLPISEVWSVQRRKWKLSCEYLDQWRLLEAALGTDLDAIIAPITPTAAIRHGKFAYHGYATFVNFFDLPSVVVPVTFANKDIDAKNESYVPKNKVDQEVYDEYDAEAYHGAPVAVQIIGRRLTEEALLLIAEEVGRLLGNEIVP